MTHFQRSISLALFIATIAGVGGETRLPITNVHAQDATDRPVGLPEVKPETYGIATTSLAEIDELVEQGIEDQKLPGAVVLIGYRGSIIFHRAYGNRQVTPERLPMTTETLFDLASLTKPIVTATSIMMLVDQGVIRIEDRVAEHLPEFANQGKEKITIEHLLLHTSGLIPDNAMRDYEGSRESAIDHLMNLSLAYETDTDFKYSDVGFLILGELIYRKTGKTVHEFTQEYLFEPLDMQRTGFVPSDALRATAATTEQRGGKWIQGEVHDPRAFALGGVAGHAGLFSTASDLAIYAQMMVQRGQYNGRRYLSPSIFQRMTAGYKVPGGGTTTSDRANDRLSNAKGIRGLGWDKRSGYSSNRPATMSESAIGHGGFTGTALWIDPELELFVIFLSNRVHPNGQGSVNGLAGQVGTVAADAVISSAVKSPESFMPAVLCGIDVLELDSFQQLRANQLPSDQGSVSIGLITNHTGVNRLGKSTASILAQAPQVELKAIFSPEHGIAGNLDQAEIPDAIDPETGKRIFSLYGQDRKPSIESLQAIDTLVFDIQDIGTRFYTYISTMGNAMEVAEKQGLRFIVLDRPNPIGGELVSGPMLDAGQESFVGYHSLPVRHGMTVGELAKMFQAERFPQLRLEIVPCRGWNRGDHYDATELLWVNPSPNMRNLNQALLYPGCGLLEYTNLSVGRGTDTPFEQIGAPWIDASRLARRLNQMELEGIRFVPKNFTPESSKFENQECHGVHLLITDRNRLDGVKIGLGIATALRELHGKAWDMQPLQRLLGSLEVFQAIADGRPLDEVAAVADKGKTEFLKRREKYLIYSSKP